MAVRIRLARYGRTHRPYYRVVAIDSREHREGKANEILGVYDPLLAEKNLNVEIERVHFWLQNGARLNKSVESLLKHFGYEAYPQELLESRSKQKAAKKARWAKRQKKDGSKWAKPNQRALKKHKAKVKAERMAVLAKELEAKAAAKAAAEAASAEAEAPAEEG